MIDNNLPFEMDNGEKSHIGSIESALCAGCSYDIEGISIVEDALINDFPNDPDLISHMLHFYLKKEFMERADLYYGQLMKMPDEAYTLRCYVAMLCFKFVTDPDDTPVIEGILKAMETKYPNDMANRFASDAFQIVCEGMVLSVEEASAYYRRYEALKDVLTDGNYYSDWISIVLPLLEIIVGKYITAVF